MNKTERIPLLKDYHNHPFLFASLAGRLDLSNITIKKEALSLITGRFASEEFVFVTGWYDSGFAFADNELDYLPPLVIFNISLHSMFINRAARERLSVSFPDVIENYRKEGWLERNAPKVLDFILRAKPCGANDLRLFFDRMARLGVWYVEEMTLQGETEFALFRETGLSGRTRFWSIADVFASLGEESKRHVHGIKLFADGAVGARTARLGECYRGGEEGVMVWSEAELHDRIEWASGAGKSLAVHAIGNVAVDLAVHVLEQSPELRKAFPEIRLEHCQFISSRAAMKAKSMGIILCLQPNFSLDSTCYADRLPEAYRLRNNPLRMLIDEAGYVPGEDLLFGSDGMPHGARPALESALFPPVEGQRLTLDEFVAGYCMPDFSNGYIDVSVDYEGRRVGVEVAPAGKR